MFDTTHHALWAEQVALGAGLGALIESAPVEARARCALALAYLPSEEADLLALLQRTGVPFRVYTPSETPT